jgi:spore germination cell wall hydrolase CwlJ-like protein
MRICKNALGAFVICLAAIATGPAATNANQVEDLIQEEKRALGAVSLQRLKTMLTAPKARPVAGSDLSRDWVDSQPEASGGPELKCLAEALYFEARGETVKGQVAVAEVIMNRVKSERFPSTACDVINQGTGRKHRCQFSYTCDGLAETISEPVAYSRVSKVARAVLDGRVPDLTDGATHYHTTAVNPKWSKVYVKTASIGDHVFYRHTWQTASN